MINPVVYSISLDIYKIGSQKVLSMVRGDTKRSIVISLTENDRPYVIAQGCTAVFTAKKPDGNFIYNDCEIDFKNNTIVYNVTEQTTAVNGKVDCQLRLIGSNGGIVSSPSFGMVVADLLYNEEPIVESSSEFNALTKYIADLQYKVDNGDFNGKSIYVRGSVDDVSELDAKIPYAEAGDGYITGDDHLYVFDGVSFVDVGLVRGPQGLPGVYVGDGDMPEGYSVQIDPDGAALEMDAELNAESQNPVENRAIARRFRVVDGEILDIKESVASTKNDVDNHAFRIGTLETASNQLSDHSIDHEGRLLTLENAKAAEPEKFKMLYEAEWSDYLYGVTIPGISKYVLVSGVVTVYDGASTTVKGIYPVLFFRSPSSSAYVTYGSTFNDGGQSFELKVDLATENVKTNIAGSVKVSCLTGIY